MQIQEPIDFMPMAGAMLERINPTYDTYPCPRCGTGVNFPRVARRQDIDDFAMVLEVAHKYLSDNGVMDKILADLFGKISEKRRSHLHLVT